MYITLSEKFPKHMRDLQLYKIRHAPTIKLKVALAESLLFDCRLEFTENSLPSVISMYYIGHWKLLQSRYADARKSLKSALNMVESHSEESELSYLILNDLSFACIQLKDYLPAYQFKMESLDLLVKIYGKNHPLVSVCLENAGMILYHLNEHRRGRNLFYQSLNIKLSAWGMNHPTFRESLHYGEKYYPGSIEYFAACV